jgi:hypothetical protein
MANHWECRRNIDHNGLDLFLEDSNGEINATYHYQSNWAFLERLGTEGPIQLL